MNKTININLAGTFFHIDEIAFLKLRHYLDAISQSLMDDPQGKDEILKDIEQRIGELFNEKLSKERQVINENDVDEVISVMGQPEDYQYDDELFKSNQSKTTKSKKLYRSGKDKILGGVASGIGHYIGMDATWVRIIWLLLMIPWGFSFWIYIILWIIVPEAKTTAEELEMMGEPVTIDNIEKKIKEEYSDLEKRVKNADYSHVKNGFQQILETIGSIFKTFFNLFGKFIGVILIIMASLTLVGLIIGLFSLGTVEIMGYDNDHINYPEFFNLSVVPTWILVLAMLFAIMIPFVYLFILGINIISNKKLGLGKTGNLSLLGVWLISLFTLAFAGIEHGTQFANENFISINKQYTLKEKDTLYIRMLGNDLISNRKSLYRSDNLEEVTDTNGLKQLYSSYVHVDIRRSSDDKMMIKVLKTARGYTKEKALSKAENITYSYELDKNKLNLDAYFLTNTDLKYSRPKIDVIIYVPDNKVLYLDHSTSSFLYDVHNVQDVYDSDMANHYFIMNSEGLNCTDCIKNIENVEDVDIDIDTKGININIDNGKDQAKVKVDENGIEIR